MSANYGVEGLEAVAPCLPDSRRLCGRASPVSRLNAYLGSPMIASAPADIVEPIYVEWRREPTRPTTENVEGKSTAPFQIFTRAIPAGV